MDVEVKVHSKELLVPAQSFETDDNTLLDKIVHLNLVYHMYTLYQR